MGIDVLICERQMMNKNNIFKFHVFVLQLILVEDYVDINNLLYPSADVMSAISRVNRKSKGHKRSWLNKDMRMSSSRKHTTFIHFQKTMKYY